MTAETIRVRRPATESQSTAERDQLAVEQQERSLYVAAESHLRVENARQPRIQRIRMLQRVVGNQVIAQSFAQRQACASQGAGALTSPGSTARNVASLTHQELLAELSSTQRWLSTAQPSDKRYAETNSYQRDLLEERRRRVQAGQVWLAANAGANRSTLYQLLPQGDITVVRETGSGGSGTGGVVFTAVQLQQVLAREGVPTVRYASLLGMMSAASNAQGPGVPNAGHNEKASLPLTNSAALPTGHTLPWLSGRFYPFARPLLPHELAAIRSQQALHYTAEANLPRIVQPGGNVNLRPSTGYRNLTVPGFHESSYFFAGEPSAAEYGTNVGGRGPISRQGVIVVQGSDLPPGTLFRPIDNTLVVPGGYRGPGTAVQSGQSLPPAHAHPSALVSTQPNTLSSALAREGSFSGNAVSAGVASGVIAIVMETGVVFIQTGQAPSGERVIESGITGMGGGAVGSVSENLAARGLVQLAPHVGGRVFVTMGRGLAGGVGGAVAAPVVEMGRMALDQDHDYTATDYAARGTRASAAGAFGGLLGAGATGALAGSVAPGVGTAIGFVVGIGGYILADWLIGDAVESGVRGALR